MWSTERERERESMGERLSYNEYIINQSTDRSLRRCTEELCQIIEILIEERVDLGQCQLQCAVTDAYRHLIVASIGSLGDGA
jgi:hypothetical protein